MQMIEPVNGRELYGLSSAWVVTWTYFAYDDAPEEFVCIFDTKTRPDYVLRRVEQQYVSTRLSMLRQLQYADDRDSLAIHEQAHFVLGTYKNEIWCGLHPTLYARKVENIRIIRDTLGKEHLVWDDPDHTAAREEIMAQLAKTPIETEEETE
jgi:hypothetical protein